MPRSADQANSRPGALLWVFRFSGKSEICYVFHTSESILLLRKLRFSDDYLVDQIHHAQRTEQVSYSVNSED